MEAVSEQLNALNVLYEKTTDRIMALRDRKREQPDEKVKEEIQLEIDEVVTEKQKLEARIVSLEQLFKRAQAMPAYGPQSPSTMSPSKQILAKLDEILKRSDRQDEMMAMLMRGLCTPAKSTVDTQIREDFREACLRMYEGTAVPESILDMITGEELPDQSNACRIIQARWTDAFLVRLGLTKTSGENGFFTLKAIEDKLDQHQAALMVQEDGSIQFKLLDPRLFKSFYEAGKDSEGNKVMKKWADLDGSVLQSRTGALPAKRACVFHAYWAVKYAELNFKLEEGKMQIPDSAFSSP